jgi:phosphoglycerate dehydrogenase-like enzyme
MYSDLFFSVLGRRQNCIKFSFTLMLHLPYNSITNLHLCNSKNAGMDSNLKVGILGAGQLGKMLLQAASRWDIALRVMD